MLDCNLIKTPFIEQFNKEPMLLEFLTESTIDLPTTTAIDNSTDVNLCNADRVVNIATLYMASALKLNLEDVMTGFDFDASATYVFPENTKHGPKEIFPPSGLADFPNLEQAYWTIISRYTKTTEPGLRKGKNDMWCYHHGIGVHAHCKDTNQKVTKCADNTVCNLVYSNFVEACHRILSRDTSDGFYKLNGNENQFCLPGWALGDTKLYYLYRR